MSKEKFKAELGLDNNEFKKKLKESEGSVGKFGGAVKKIGAAMAAAFSVNAIIGFAKEAVKLAAAFEGVSVAFKRIAAPGLLESLRSATRGTVTDLQLMQNAIQASNFDIPLTQLSTLLKFAGDRALQTGQNVDYLVDSIILGIGRKSPLILDNLGISAVRLREELKGAEVELTTVADVAAAVGKIAAEEMRKMGDVADTTATQIANISTAWTNLKTGIGGKIAQSGAFKSVVGWMGDFGKILQAPGMTFSSGLMAMLFKRKEIVSDVQQLEEKVSNEYRKQAAAQTQNVRNITKIHEITKGILRNASGIVDESLEDKFAKIITGKSRSELKSQLAPNTSSPGQMIKEFSSMQEALMNLAGSFASFFSDVNLGFQGMIDGIITGLKRLVMELIAKSAILAILSVITGVPLSGAMFTNLLFGGNIGSLIKGGAINAGEAVGSAPMSGPVEFVLKGKDLYGSVNRYSQELGYGT